MISLHHSPQKGGQRSVPGEFEAGRSTARTALPPCALALSAGLAYAWWSNDGSGSLFCSESVADLPTPASMTARQCASLSEGPRLLKQETDKELTPYVHTQAPGRTCKGFP